MPDPIPQAAYGCTLTCAACQARHQGTRSNLVCPRCWERLTPNGRAYRADRQARWQRERRKGGKG
jgi:hypothetical protein